MTRDLKAEFARILEELGVKTGKTVYLHSFLLPFFEVARITGPDNVINFFLSGLQDAVGERGTIVVPGFTTDCARRGLPFDLDRTPTDAGAFAESLRRLDGAHRSLHPVNSVIAIGDKARLYTQDVSRGSYSWDSPFDRMANEDTVVLCMGMTESLSNSFSHYAETACALPYIYNKILDYIPVTVDGMPFNSGFYMSVRYLDYGIQPSRVRHDQVMRASGLMRFGKWGGGHFHAIKTHEYLSLLRRELRQDPFFLLSGPPVFRKGERPADGMSVDTAIKQR
jgi:aminoglycoside 3-N-acetyltransferase